MNVEVIYSVWGADGEEYSGGVHEIEKPSAKFLKLAAAAEHAGAIKVTASAEERKKMNASVESQTDSEAANAEAVESGEWHKANLAQFIADAETSVAGDLAGTARAFLETGLADAKAMQKHIDGGASYDEAAEFVKASG